MPKWSDARATSDTWKMYPKIVRDMWAKYGHDPNHTCGDCGRLITTNPVGKAKYACPLADQTSADAADWRTHWFACLQFLPK